MDFSNEKVALCMPVYDRVFPKAWIADMALAIHLGNIIPEENLGIFISPKMAQPHAQNYLFNAVLSNTGSNYVQAVPVPSGKADWVLWVEDDTTPPYNAFDLLRSKADPIKRPVMHALAFDRVSPHSPIIFKSTDEGVAPLWEWKDDTVYRIAHSGTCLCLIHTSVFEKMKRPWFRMQPFEPGCPGIIPCISLSQRMHEADIPIHAYTGCIVGHIGEPIEVNAEISREMGKRLGKC